MITKTKGFSMGVASSITSIHQRVTSTVSQSMVSIRDGYRYSRRTGSFYAMEDLPKEKPTADFAMMLGSLSSMHFKNAAKKYFNKLYYVKIYRVYIISIYEKGADFFLNSSSRRIVLYRVQNDEFKSKLV